MSEDVDADVTVVGYGPVGQLLAILRDVLAAVRWT